MDQEETYFFLIRVVPEKEFRMDFVPVSSIGPYKFSMSTVKETRLYEFLLHVCKNLYQYKCVCVCVCVIYKGKHKISKTKVLDVGIIKLNELYQASAILPIYLVFVR